MATGKTTVGRLVAKSLGRPFVDLDRLVEELAGMTVVEIFRSKGETAFRRWETQALEQALAVASTVVATGGGAACRQDNLQLMLERGFVLALSVTPAEAINRTRSGGSGQGAGAATGRPLLDDAVDPLGVAQQLLRDREPFYRQAHLRVDTVGKTPAEVAAEVLSALRKEGQS